MSLAVFEIPNKVVRDLVAEGKRVDAIKERRKQDHRLLSGVQVKPRLRECTSMVYLVENNLWGMPMCIPADGYVLKD